MSRTIYSHIHSYRAVSPARKQYKCIKTECTHIVSTGHLLGRPAECVVCGTKIVVDQDMIRRTNITCLGCGRAKFMPNIPSKLTEPNMKNLLDRVKV